MEADEDKKKKLNDDVVVFMRKRSEADSPRYTARLKTYVDFQQKRRRAAAARRNSEHGRDNKGSIKKNEGELKRDPADAADYQGDDDHLSRKKGVNEQKCSHHRSESFSRSGSQAPSDRCGRRRRRRRSGCRRRRRRSCRRKRRRSCRRRRRRSCCRRRRRRSCRRRRRCGRRRRRR